MLHHSKLGQLRPPDLEKERSEKPLSTEDFLASYNADLPEAFPRASLDLLNEFKQANPSLFKGQKYWTLGRYRKKLMDWLPQRTGMEWIRRN